MDGTDVQIAFLAEGKLYVKRGALAPQLIESTFAQNIIDRAGQAAERNSWRNRTDPTGSPFGKTVIWGAAARTPEVRKVRFSGLSRCTESGKLLYALDTGAIGGLFTYDLKQDYENRLFHKQEFRANDLAHHPAKESVALSLPNEDGTSCIAIMKLGGRGVKPVTEGDTRDESPAWVPVKDGAEREVLVYQTSGLARNERGHVTGQGPYAISRLDIDNAKHSVVLEDSRWDYLVPRVRLENGGEVYYFIRRPYKPEGRGAYTPLKLAVDILLFPFRLLRAIFAFLNVFSMFFSQKPLTTAGGPKQEQMDTRYLVLHGKWIDAQKAVKAANKGEALPLVPANWELVQMTSDGKLNAIACSVLSYDFLPDGGLVYTNGSEVYVVRGNEKGERMCAHRMIQQVMAVH